MGAVLQSSLSHGEATTFTELRGPSAKEPHNAPGAVSLPPEHDRLTPERSVERVPVVSQLILHVLQQEGPRRPTLLS